MLLETKTSKAKIGIALDGDADRILVVDSQGNSIDGDRIIALLATDMQNNGELKSNKVVSTIMSNIGLEFYLKKLGINLIRTEVGDKHVVNKMREYECNLGGEQSGHIIIGRDQATGDGIKVALRLLAIYLKHKEKKIGELFNLFENVPQFICNINCEYELFHLLSNQSSKFEEIVCRYRNLLGESGRILARLSGTEPIVRLMVESSNELLARNILSILKKEVEDHINSLILSR
jgi:phosphoglucosamine mutase